MKLFNKYPTKYFQGTDNQSKTKTKLCKKNIQFNSYIYLPTIKVKIILKP